MNHSDVLNFWFNELEPKDWYVKNPSLDQTIKDRFLGLYNQAANCELYTWRSSIEGRLAEIIILDQFSRNMFRNSPEAFQFDHLAVALSQEASRDSQVNSLESRKKAFIFMPLMHSESSIVHEQAMTLFNQVGLENSFEYEKKHKAIIDRFGRYPHRNEILGRKSTPDEIEFLKGPDSSF